MRSLAPGAGHQLSGWKSGFSGVPGPPRVTWRIQTPGGGWRDRGADRSPGGSCKAPGGGAGPVSGQCRTRARPVPRPVAPRAQWCSQSATVDSTRMVDIGDRSKSILRPEKTRSREWARK